MHPAARVYYDLKPLLPAGLRLGLRRWHARRRRPRRRHEWPVLPGSEQPPAGWPGWPDGRKFAVVLTHDVEGAGGYARIRELVRLEQELGFRSSFNLVPEGAYRVGPEMRRWLAEQGCEVGVHDLYHDGKLYRSREEFTRRARKINRYVQEWGAAGFRSAYMHHQLDWLGELDIAYDASTFDTDPFEPQPDGVGTIFPFWVPRSPAAPTCHAEVRGTKAGAPSEGGRATPKHPSEGGSPDPRPQTPDPDSPSPALNSQLSTLNSQLGSGFVELPYTLAQDSTLFLFLGEQTIDLWKQKVDWIAKHGGMVLVNVHPDYLAFDGRATHQVYPVNRYRELLQYVRDTYSGQYWHALPREVAAWIGSARRAAVPAMSPVAEAIERPGKDASPLAGKRVAVLLYSEYLSDPRPRRAAEALARSGMSVEVLCLRGNSAGNSGPQTVNGVRIWRVPLTHSREGVLRYLFQYAAFFLWSAAFCLRSWFAGRYDLVHVHNMPDFLALAALPAKLRGARVILDLHDPMPELYQAIYGLAEDHWMVSLLKELERQSIRFADRVLTPNLAFQRIFEQRSCDPGKIEIVMNSPEESVFMEDVPPAALPPPPGDGPPFRVLHHGSIVHRHGLDIAIEAVAIARQTIPSIQFIICGRRTRYLDEVLALAARRGLSGVVHYLGPKTQPEIAAHVAACDVGVIPNRLSPFTAVNMPTRIFEYLAVDRPVIAPATEGIRDYFDESNLIFFRPDDAADLARQLIWVAQHRAEAAARVELGKVIYRQQVWGRQREHFLNLVTELLTRS